ILCILSWGPFRRQNAQNPKIPKLQFAWQISFTFGSAPNRRVAMSDESFNLIATSAFGLEALVVRELGDLGYEAKVARPGRIAFRGDATALCRANMWLRCSDRVLVEVASF